ncbi:hypothetical protein KIPB_005454, partial [Kipferlia bialata]|eukprot:g5454.t1
MHLLTDIRMSKDAGPEVTVTTRELKDKWYPVFADETSEYNKCYPTEVFKRLNYVRARCPTCTKWYWHHESRSEEEGLAMKCGDPSCVEEYTFVGEGCGIGFGEDGVKIDVPQAWATFQETMEATTPKAHTAIPRYPVVARWRDDCEFTAAGIQCFQPYCVTGELEPPANPLICPQFCLRFNDLDSIGLSGRHYSGFHMIGVQ